MELKILVNEVSDGNMDYRAAIRCAGEKLLEKGYITAQYIEACLAREKSYPTGLLMANGQGIAIPHADYTLVKTDSISVVRFSHDVTFGQMEDADLSVGCGIVFNLAFASSDRHLAILRRLFTLFQDLTFIESCRSLKTDEVGDYIQGMLQAQAA